MKILKFIITLFLLCFLIFILLDKLYPLNQNALNKEQSLILKDINGEILSMKISSDEIWRFHARDDEIPKRLKQSVIYFEDRYFYYHFGINPMSIFRAFYYNIKRNFTTTGIRRVGASTIDMQVARMINAKKRNYSNKIKEMFIAFQLNWYFSKDEILTFYFNLAPYGGNIEGVKTASYFYFGKNLNELSNAQMALLSVIPKNPNANRLDKISNISKVKNRLITALYKAKILDKSEFLRAKTEPFENRRFSVPNFATHYSNLAFKNSKNKNGEIISNLDLKAQKALQIFLSNQIENLKTKSLKNGAALLIDNEKQAVIAYVGSHNKNSPNGENDGVISEKNVGSTLKPFIYAKALEMGLITPNKELIDTQINFQNYVPKNFNDHFVGVISANNALNFSLNIPAVNLNLLLGQNSLYEMLQKANLTTHNKEYYGAGIALGGISLSLLDLARLYSVFANDGKLKNLEIAGKIIPANTQILSEQSAYLVAKILQNAPRSYLNTVWKNTQNKPNIMFKTGTSADSRDLYTIALNPKFTLAIWLGNFSGAKTADLSGGMSAAKVAFNMFDFLDKNYGSKEFTKPLGIQTQNICLDAYPLEKCRNFGKDEIISGVDLNQSCDIYGSQELFFLVKNGYFSKDDLKNSRCGDKFLSIKPVLNDIDKKIYETTQNGNFRLQIRCQSVFAGAIYISLNGEDYKEYKSTEDIFLDLKANQYELKCMDENANLSVVNFSVIDP